MFSKHVMDEMRAMKKIFQLTQLHPLVMLLPALPAMQQRELHLFQPKFVITEAEQTELHLLSHHTLKTRHPFSA